MSFSILATEKFKRQAKQQIKKYVSLKNELQDLIFKLKSNPKQGTAIGHECYKIRFSISYKSKGKSGNARVITCMFIE